ncbi:FtsK/SpoIIIE family DNA translocase [Fibrobacter succinogenes]|uniref:DNA segregation ATPase FtsK/SpoIIIE, S-DNA-T family n=1 Tax=Fibrobacter succinogenes TaxID=833 RepID=A0A380RW11_FIBSU|nr:DNA translocase FtsK [Fibrobacter succinogenes]PWJ37481.1 S-DNA-T family DNA segregation ATPase FtsK/SpoIIIE [Fibrobacter succinogenes subsp. elongatus]SUQ19728.1 DNA segregation ATPase FtsK/SpoIIIE, S-DNA-T family [Fibrobacter succinogenes]
MAAQKKKTVKKTKKPKVEPKKDIQEPDSYFVTMMVGYLVLLAGIILLLGCITISIVGEHENWLGDYFGVMFPSFMTFLFGRVAVVVFTAALVLWGLFIAIASLREKLLRFAVGASLLVVNVSFLMSLKNFGLKNVSNDALSMSGGVLGEFFLQNLAIPVFGRVSIVAPLIILLVTLALILVLSFGVRPRHFKFVAQTMRYLAGLFGRRRKDENVEPKTEYVPNIRDERTEKKQLRRGVVMEDETMIFVPDSVKMRRRGKVEPFNGRHNWLTDDLDVNRSEMQTQVGDSFGLPQYAAGNVPGNAVPENVAANASIANVANAPAGATLGGADDDGAYEDPEIRRLEEELRLNERHMNALQILEIKERIGALRRARDLIDWEKGHKGRMQVKGDVRRTAGSETVDAAIAGNAGVNAGGNAANVGGAARRTAERTVVGKVEVPKSAKSSTSANTIVRDATLSDSVATRAAIHAEELLGGDGAYVEDFPGSPAVEDDETYTPVVVTADEVGEDPTFGADFGATMGGAGRVGGSAGGSARPAVHSATIPAAPTASYDEYKVPEIAKILDTHEVQTADYTEEELNAIGKMLEEKLENFKVKGRVIGCETGPMITRFEVEPGPGVKVSRFSALQEDLALPLKVSSIRILAPIPGKAAVGVEIPNRKFQTVFCRDVFMSEKFKPAPDKILVALGKDITGEAFTMDLAKAPHLLIAGQTGSGKSVCINALMASMLFSKTPDELRMILVDPKAVELKMYENIPHLLAPVITKPEIAIQALQWLCYEMDRRTEVLASAKVRNIGGFNAKFEAGELPDEVPEEDRGHRMAFIVVIIDEMADLMMVAGKEIEKSVARLAAKARAVGIHLVLATQRPSVKVITGIIKANLPTRISFKVASQIDARTVMDHAGAEKLLGRGDMLYKAVNDPDPVRVHGAFLSDEEAERLADACSDQNVFYPQVESFDVSGGEEGDDEGGGSMKNEKLDKLLFEVAQWAISVNGLSTSAVQRHFSVGYSRAGKIVDQLYGLGVCGPSKGNSKPRAMLVGMDELMQLERSGRFG